VRTLDQFTKLTETKVLNEIQNMNSNLDLIRERMRVDHSQVEDNQRVLQKHTEQLNRAHEKLLELKQTMSTELNMETKALRT
jgi:hypothetical protein